MNTSKVIEILSALPQDRLDHYRFALNVAIASDPFGAPTARKYIDEINLALEAKQADYWTLYEDLESNPIGI